MATPPNSPPLTDSTSHSPSTMKRTRKATQLRSLATRPVGVERPLVQVDPTTGKADGPHRKKLRTYLGIVARDKVEFDIFEAFDLRMKKKILQIVGERWRQFKFDLKSKWALVAGKDGVDDTVCKKKQVDGGKEKKQLEEVAKFGSTDTIIDPLSPISRHESCVDSSGNDPDTSDLEKCGLYVKENPPCLVALGRLYEGSTTVHNIPLCNDQVKVGVEEVRYADALIPVPTQERAVGPAKPADRLFNNNFPLYIKHEDLSEIAHVYIDKWSSFCPRKMLSPGFVRCIIGQTTTSNELLTGFDNTPQSKSKVAARWIVVKYFNDARPLEPERLNVLCIEWASYYLKVKNETISV
ncbi:hypothetical protein HKD37_10G027675 [Glycine soja]